MNTLSAPHAQGHPAGPGTSASRATGKGGPHAPNAGADADPADAFACLMQSLTQGDVSEPADAAATGDETGVNAATPGDATLAPPSPLPTLADAAPETVGSGLAAAMAAALASDGASGPGAAAGGRGLAWAQPGDGLPPGFAAAAQAGGADARPPGLARLSAASGATGNAPATTPPAPGLGIGLQALGRQQAAADPGTSPQLAALVSQFAAGVADDRRTAASASSPAGITSLDAAAALAGAPPLDTAATAPLLQADMQAGPRDAGFASELAAQVDVMVQGDMQHAELRLNPVDLGPIRIELRLDGHTADVIFSATHELTREGISHSLEQLREMLASQGLSLGQAQVDARHAGQDGQGGQGGSQQAARPSRAGGDGGDSATQATSVALRPRALRGMLDLYA